VSKRVLSILSVLSVVVFGCVSQRSAAENDANPNSPAARARWVRDFNGVWSPVGAQQDMSVNLLPGEEISLTRFGAEQYLKVDESDSPAYKCEPYGPTRMMSSALPFQVFETPDAIGMVFEHVDYRIIYMDGRPHPEDILDYPLWAGHSIGRWEGDTLVVDTIGMREESWLDSFGLQHSGQLHVVERYRKTSPESYIWTVTVEDPVYFTKPFTYAFNVSRADYPVLPDRCEDTPPDQKYTTRKHGLVGAKHRIPPTFPAGMSRVRADGAKQGSEVAGNILFARRARRTEAPKTQFEEDVIPTSRGDLKITSLAKSSVMFTFEGKVIYVDPVAQFADYSRLPKADLILITNDESDHLDTKTIELLSKNGTALVVCPFCSIDLPTGTIMINGETQTVAGLRIEAVAAYNIKGRGGNGKPFTVKGTANGYVVTFGDKRVYVASQTENVPEVKALRNIDVAFLPVNNTGFGAQLNTMNHEMFADTVKAMRPKIVFPYNYGNNDPQTLAQLVAGEQGIEVRVRKMN